MKFVSNGNWGLKFLALALAIIIYHALKNENSRTNSNHDRTIFQSR